VAVEKAASSALGPGIIIKANGGGFK